MGRGRSAARDAAAREALEPLEPGQRPLAVTLGAIVSALIAASILVAYAAGVEVDGKRPALAQVLAPALLLGVMAAGMWRARYWAVLGFQVVLAILLLSSSLGLIQAASGWQVAGNLAVIAVAGAFFWFMVKALARIQMPGRPSRE